LVVVASTVAPVESHEAETLGTKVAVTLLAELIVKVQVLEVPVQAPPHPVKVLPEDAAANSVTLAPEDIFAEHVLPHEIPPVLVVTVPVPVPLLETESVYVLATAVKVAVTER